VHRHLRKENQRDTTYFACGLLKAKL